MNTPDSATLAWAAGALGAERPARVVRCLAGGSHADTHLLETSAGRAVLRRFPTGDDAAANEARTLTALDGLGGFAPRLLAADPDGARTGRPATLITVLPGAPDILHTDPGAAAARLGRALARLHAVPTGTLAELRDGVATSDAAPARRLDQGPTGPIVDAHARTIAAEPRVLTHSDFWAGNVMWSDGELTGVIDWSGGSLAPRGFDVGWCRLDLVILHGSETAAAFLDAYENAAGYPVANVELWDLYTLRSSHQTVETWVPNYRDLGRTDLTADALRARHTAWTHECLHRWNSRTSPSGYADTL
ncbi:phosphotransferase family protein [Actinomadura sp. WMMB 499]|uniref:phosphotransferase family protein n=1 Tax=Actinomadura sp. WMMB 499 TaxID=1219491 RepID=UPI00159D3C03|nr:aminoglycoside phosphotransferase family protein [Actinomadura sp. WMMB 499]